MTLTHIVSHRGGALLWTENSRTAFENTARLAVEQVEFDVHPSRDGKLVVIHDATLDRTTNGTGPVADLDWAELSQLALKGTGDERILLLDEVMAIFKPTSQRLRLEIKAGPGRVPYPGLPGQVMAALQGAGMLDRTTITSFQLPTVAAALRHGRPWNDAWLVTPDLLADTGLPGVIELAKAAGVRMLGIRSNVLDASVVAQVRAAGLGIGGWACNHETSIRKMLDLAVDVFTTDRPDLALQLRDGQDSVGSSTSRSQSPTTLIA